MCHNFVCAEAVVGFESLVYSVYEDDEEVEICVTVYSPTTDCPIAFPFEVVFEANPDTACMCIK